MKTILAGDVQAASTTYQPRGLEQNAGNFRVSPWFLINNVESFPASQVVGKGETCWIHHNLLAGGSLPWLCIRTTREPVKKGDAGCSWRFRPRSSGLCICIIIKLQEIRRHRQDQVAMYYQAKAKVDHRNTLLHYLDEDGPSLVLRLPSAHLKLQVPGNPPYEIVSMYHLVILSVIRL